MITPTGFHQTFLGHMVSANSVHDWLTRLLNHPLVQAYQLGLGIGVIVLTTLILFPGKAKAAMKTEENRHEDVDTKQSSTSTLSEDRVEDRNYENFPVWAKPSSSSEYSTSQSSTRATSHRQMNLVVYAVLFSIGSIVLWHEYGSPEEATAWKAYARSYLP